MSLFDYNSVIQVQDRASFGTITSKKLRASGFVPFSVYNAGKSSHFTIDEKTLNKLLSDPSLKTRVLKIKSEKSDLNVIAKDFHFDTIKDAVLHFECMEVNIKKEIKFEAPISIIGKAKSPGVKRNGKVNVIRYNVPLIANDAKSIIEEIVIDISTYGLGKTLFSDAISLPNGVKVDGSFPILSIIGRGKKDEEEDAAAAAAATATPAASDKKDEKDKK